MEEERNVTNPELYTLLKPERIITDTYEESYEDYKERRKMVNKVLKQYQKGRIKHVSIGYLEKVLGLKGRTYIKEDNAGKTSKHGEEGA